MDFSIDICKYRIDDVTLKENCILLTGVDKTHAALRVPALPPKTVPVHKNQIAKYAEYVYFPLDQVSDIMHDTLFRFPQPVAVKTMQKAEWKKIKKTHLYEM